MSQTLMHGILSKIGVSNLSLDFNVKERGVLLFIVDFLILISALFFYYQIGYPESAPIQIMIENLDSSLYAVTLFFILSTVFNLYNLEYANTTRKIVPLVAFIGILFGTIFVFTPIITPSFPDRRIYVIGFVFGLSVMLVIWRMFYAHYIHSPAFFKNVIVLVSDKFDEEFVSKMKQNIEGSTRENGYLINRLYTIPESEVEKEHLEDLINRLVDRQLISNIVILDTNHENISDGLNKVFVKAIQSGVDVQTYLNLYEELKEALPLNLVGRQFYSIFPIARHNANYFYQLWNRILDIVSAMFGLIVLAIIIPFIHVINKFSNPGPLFYSQLRVGRGGEEYKLTKFRSMVTDAEKSGALMAVKSDNRVTKFGAILRKTRMDELPQFWAVLRGFMSLIGPRPERKVFVDDLGAELPFYNTRHLIKPGITGWAQVKYPYGENFQDSYNKLEYDLYYIKNRSVTMDIRIVLKTVNSVIFSKGQ